MNRKSWKTTLGGLLSSAGALASASQDETVKHVGAVLAAVGLLLLGLAARDNDKTSEDVRADQKSDSRFNSL